MSTATSAWIWNGVGTEWYGVKGLKFGFLIRFGVEFQSQLNQIRSEINLIKFYEKVIRIANVVLNW